MSKFISGLITGAIVWTIALVLLSEVHEVLIEFDSMVVADSGFVQTYSGFVQTYVEKGR